VFSRLAMQQVRRGPFLEVNAKLTTFDPNCRKLDPIGGNPR
jgi:hypothetical protein